MGASLVTTAASVTVDSERSEPGFRVRTFLRDLRGRRSLNDVAAATGVAKGELSQLERGHLLPRAEIVARLVAVYGDPDGWYPPTVQHALAGDVRLCGRCGGELPPSASRRRKYHEACPRTVRRSDA